MQSMRVPNFFPLLPLLTLENAAAETAERLNSATGNEGIDLTPRLIEERERGKGGGRG